MEVNTAIKMVVFDLDYVIWDGALLETEISIDSAVIEYIKTFKAYGVKAAIAANTHAEEAMRVLKDARVFELFDEIQIGYRNVSSMIKQMCLKNGYALNEVLYLTERELKRIEVSWVNRGIRVGRKSDLGEYVKAICDNGKLEEIQPAQKNTTPPLPIDHDFTLYKYIQPVVSISPGVLDIPKLFRLFSMSVQLNYTKQKMSEEEFRELLANNRYKCGVIVVSARNMKREAAGFYCLDKENYQLKHFVFSFEYFGFGIEQFVYSELGFPEVQIIGETASKLNTFERPFWVTLWPAKKDRLKILVKGQCDLVQSSFYTNKKKFELICENVIFNDYGIRLSSLHVCTLRAILDLDDATKDAIVQEFPIYTPKIFDTALFGEDYDIAVFSLIHNYIRKLYYNKSLHIKQELGLLYADDVPYRKLFDLKIKGSEWDDFDAYFNDKYLPCGHMAPEEFIQELEYIVSHITKPVIFLNMPELDMPYLGDALFRRRCEAMNSKMEEFIKTKSNCYLIDVRKFIKTKDEISDDYAHYGREAYAWIAGEIEKIASYVYF